MLCLKITYIVTTSALTILIYDIPFSIFITSLKENMQISMANFVGIPSEWANPDEIPTKKLSVWFHRNKYFHRKSVQISEEIRRCIFRCFSEDVSSSVKTLVYCRRNTNQNCHRKNWTSNNVCIRSFRRILRQNVPTNMASEYSDKNRHLKFPTKCSIRRLRRMLVSEISDIYVGQNVPIDLVSSESVIFVFKYIFILYIFNLNK